MLERMDKTLTPRNLLDILRSVQPAKDKWEKIGLGLGLRRDRLQEIKTDNKDDPGKCMLTTISIWLRGESEAAVVKGVTWRVLLRTLKSREVDESALAERLMTEKGFVRLAPTMQKPHVSLPHKEEHKDEIVLGVQDLGWLLSQLTDVAPHWINFGIYLNIPHSQLKIFEANNRDVVACLRETLAYWLNKNPAAEKLLKALNKVGDKRLAQTLQKSLSLGDHRKEAAPLPEGNMLEEHLRSFYCNSSQLGGTTEWPPTLEVEYINLELISQDKIPLLHRQQIIADLSKRGEIGAALEQSQQLALEDITNYTSSRKIILVEGAPGVGKTTLAYKLCRDWANRKLLAEYWLVLYIPLRVPLMRLAESADDLLKHYGKHCSPADIQLIKQKHGRGVLFVLDGWDELRPSCRVPTSFFHKLICGEFLPESSILVTSRPGAVTHNIRTRIANRLVEILGFTADQVTQYIQLYFKDHEGAAQRLAEDLQMYPNVGSTCYVAINLTILCYVYLASGFKLPATLTEVYEQFVLHTIKHHFNRLIAKDDGSSSIDAGRLASVQTVSGFDDTTNRILRGLGRLALDGLGHGDLSFTSTEVTRVCDITEPEFDGFGLLKVLLVFRIHGTERNYQFLHLTVQEYLAAYTIFQMKEQEQAEWLQQNISNLSCDQVFKFFCGMDQFSSHLTQDIFSKIITAPFVLECVFEGQWEEACHTIAQETSNELAIIGTSPVQPYRALVYGYVMAKSGTQWQLQWKNCTVSEHELKSMSRYLLHSPKALTQISLRQAMFASKEAAILFSEVIRSQVELSEITLNTHLDDESLSIVCQVLEGHKTLKTIKISQNKISRKISDVITSLLITLHSLQTLDLSGNELEEANYRTILQAAFKSMSLQVLHLPHKSDTSILEIDQLNSRRKEDGLKEIEICSP